MQKSFILVIGFQKIEYFHFFPTVKMADKYTKKKSLDAGFQQVPLVQIFEFFTVLLWNISTLIQWRKSKIYIYFLRKNLKIQLTIEIAWARPIFGRWLNFKENIWEQNTERERQMVSDKTWSIRI